jgi:hypothetical protein
MSLVKRFASGWPLLLLGCSATPTTTPRPPATTPAAPASATASAAPPAVAPIAARPLAYRECGQLACKAFPSAAAAFDFVLADHPRVLAIGEAHAQRDAGIGASATRRFMDGLLPRLAPRASDLVLEIWVANGSCGKVEQKVQQQQAEVTAPQAATNQNEFMELGHRAKALRIMPRALVPSCEQYQKIAGAGEGDIAEMLTMIRDVTARDVRQLIAERPPERLIVAYGGAMHNDVAPRAGREDFSFGPALAEATSQRYVELDLVIPEQIKDSEAWRALPWYPHYSRAEATDEAYLFSWAPRAYALLFPKAIAPKAP